jgi:acetyl-CoA acetyltransferase
MGRDGDLPPARRAAIVGIGETKLGKLPGRTAMQLQAEAARAAVADAGLSFADIDAVVALPMRTQPTMMPAAAIAHYLGIVPDHLATLDLAGASGVALVQEAAMALAFGACRNVLCVSGQNLLSHRSRAAAIQQMAEAGAAHPQFEVPYGPLIPSLYALVAQRHMHEYGTTREQMAEVAVAMRAHAALNPNAHKREPITVADVLAAPMVTSPFGVLDCSLVSDGAAACVVTTQERARDRPHRPATMLGFGQGLSHTFIGEAKTLTTTGAARSGPTAFRASGLTPGDVDVAMLYDCFSITVLVELEDLGFCPKGEGGRFVEGGRIRLGGDLPTNTHGGLLSGGHPGLPGGFFHVLEAVRQLRGGCGARQVPDAEVALVHGNGGIIGMHATMLMTNRA